MFILERFDVTIKYLESFTAGAPRNNKEKRHVEENYVRWCTTIWVGCESCHCILTFLRVVWLLSSRSLIRECLHLSNLVILFHLRLNKKNKSSPNVLRSLENELHCWCCVFLKIIISCFHLANNYIASVILTKF